MRYGENLGICTDGNRVGYGHWSAGVWKRKGISGWKNGGGNLIPEGPTIVARQFYWRVGGAEGSRAVGTIETCQGAWSRFRRPVPGRGSQSRLASRQWNWRAIVGCPSGTLGFCRSERKMRSRQPAGRRRYKRQLQKKRTRHIFRARASRRFGLNRLVKPDPGRSIRREPPERGH